MSYCHQCHRITSGDPLFCNSCGSTYDAKLCPSRHVNPRNANVCSLCGSRDFSTPAPRVSWMVGPLLFLVSLVPGVLLALLLLAAAAAVVQQLLTNQQVQAQLLVLLLMLALAWYAYIHLPHFIRSL